MQRRSAAIEDDGVQQVPQRSDRDQPGDGLVFVQRLPGNVGHEACAEQRGEPDERERRPGDENAPCVDLIVSARGWAQGGRTLAAPTHRCV